MVLEREIKMDVKSCKCGMLVGYALNKHNDIICPFCIEKHKLKQKG